MQEIVGEQRKPKRSLSYIDLPFSEKLHLVLTGAVTIEEHTECCMTIKRRVLKEVRRGKLKRYRVF